MFTVFTAEVLTVLTFSHVVASQQSQPPNHIIFTGTSSEQSLFEAGHAHAQVQLPVGLWFCAPGEGCARRQAEGPQGCERPGCGDRLRSTHSQGVAGWLGFSPSQMWLDGTSWVLLPKYPDISWCCPIQLPGHWGCGVPPPIGPTHWVHLRVVRAEGSGFAGHGWGLKNIGFR